MENQNSINTKKIYADVYRTDGHNYGEVQGTGRETGRTREQLEAISRLLKRYGVPKDAQVAEVGCGLGHLHHCHPNWHGFEYSSTAVKLARNLHGESLKIAEADARRLPMPSNSTDVLFSFAALEHIPEVEKAFAEIERVLKPGALAMLGPAWNCRPWTVKKLQQRPYSELSIKEKVGKFLIPIRDHLIFRLACSIPSRAAGEMRLLLGSQDLPLRYTKLEPDFSLWERYPHISDDDAFVSIDAHAALVYFASRKWIVESHSKFSRRFSCRGEIIVVRKPVWQ